MSRVYVRDPASGAVLSVSEGSVQAALWPLAEPNHEPVKRKPGRPRKTED